MDGRLPYKVRTVGGPIDDEEFSDPELAVIKAERLSVALPGLLFLRYSAGGVIRLTHVAALSHSLHEPVIQIRTEPLPYSISMATASFSAPCDALPDAPSREVRVSSP